MLRNKILRRVEEYNDDILIETLFNYLISKSKDQITLENLPKINKESF